MFARIVSGAVALLVAGWLGANAGAALGRTYVANCGNTSYLQFKPDQWSGGCTGGSANIQTVRWSAWSDGAARGSGMAALREPCRTAGCAWGTYRARAKLVLSRPRPCRTEDGRRLRFFSRARWSVLYRSGNPFGLRPGWRAKVVPVYQGLCRLAP